MSLGAADLVLLFGNTRVTIMQDYEALGRYVTAEEVARKLARERDKKLAELARMIGIVTGTHSSSYLAQDFDAIQAQQLLSEVAELHQNMLAAVNDANSYADACGRPKLQIAPLIRI